MFDAGFSKSRDVRATSSAGGSAEGGVLRIAIRPPKRKEAKILPFTKAA
jgi:hypothetical protein